MMRCACLAAALWGGLLALPAYGGEPLPRVFYDDAERSVIVAHRRAGATIHEEPAAGATTGTAPVSNIQRLDGIAVARAGTHVAWINGRRYIDGSRLGDWRVQVTPQGVTLHRSTAHSRLFRVGETISVPGQGS
jgi:hypothetical protein